MSFLERVAGAPITWGVDGSPGWGYLMDPDRVLEEMVQVGLKATELGPDGYLGATTDEVLNRLSKHGLELVAGFIPVVLYQPSLLDEQLDYFDRATATLSAGGAEIAVLGADSHLPGYDQEIELGPAAWDVFFGGLERLMSIADRNGVTTALHPHWGMAIQGPASVDAVIDRSDVGFCVDTGHLALADVDILGTIERAGDRVHHIHLKDLDMAMAARVRAGELPFRQAVIDGMFMPLGEGGVDIAATITTLEHNGFDGWYVLEQDLALDADPAAGEGPIVNARNSMRFLQELAIQVSQQEAAVE